jgi:hypothetical protein
MIIHNFWIYINAWSLVHLLSGMALGYFIKKRWIGISAIITFEIWEKSLMFAGLLEHEILLDLLWDFIITIGVFWLINDLKWKKTLEQKG